MLDLETLKIISILFGIISTIVAPMLWFVKRQVDKNERLSNDVLNKIHQSAQNNHDELKTHIESIKTDLEKDIKNSKDDFEKNINKIYNSLEERDKELKNYINTNISDLKAFIADIELKIDETNKASHEIEKDLLRFQKKVSEDYVSHSFLDKIINNQATPPNNNNNEGQ